MDETNRQFYAERLEVLWSRYVAFVNFVITVTGGTVLVLVAKLVELRLEKEALPEVPLLIWLALSFAFLSAIYSILWRALAQRYMEYEILAPFADISEYIGPDRVVHCVTNPHRFEGGESKILRNAYKLAPWVVGGALVASWCLIGIHLARLL